MAMIFEVECPGGERAWAVGYPDGPLVVTQVPPGPDGCYGDVIEVDFAAFKGGSPAPCRVLRVVGGPRRPTIRVRVEGGAATRDAWMDARDAEGWDTLGGHDAEADVVWAVATREGMDVTALGGAGATVLAR